MVKYAYTHNSDPAMGLDFDRLGPAAPSPCNPLEHYLLSTLGKVRLRLGNDPPVDAIFDPEIEAIPLLVELLQDRNRYVRFYAHCALGGFEMRVFAKYLARDEVVRALEKAEHENSENEAGEQIRCVLRQIEGLKTDIDTFRLGKQ